jgi:glycosyltransferase involved in cell wall biosynthesis
MTIAIQTSFRPPSPKHSAVWNLEDHFLQALARIDPRNHYMLFNFGFWNHADLASRLAKPQASNFSVYVPQLPRRLLRWANDSWGWDICGWLLKRRQVQLLHIFEQLNPAPPDVPTLVTFYDLIAEIYPHWSTDEIRRAMRINSKRAKHFIVPSNATKQDLVRIYKIPPDQITVIHLGIDFEFFRPLASETLAQLRRGYGLPERFVLATGAHADRKNIEFLLEAYPHWRRIDPKLGLVLTGHKSPYRDSLERLVASKNLPSVSFVGEVPPQDLAGLYNSAAVFCYPSVYEGFGMPIVEAMACGCPVAAARTSGIPEAAGPAGVLFSLDQPQELIEGVAKILSSPDHRAQLVARGHEWVKQFTWESNARQTLALYQNLIRAEDTI